MYQQLGLKETVLVHAVQVIATHIHKFEPNPTQQSNTCKDVKQQMHRLHG